MKSAEKEIERIILTGLADNLSAIEIARCILAFQKSLPNIAEAEADLCDGGIDPGWDECPKCGATADDPCAFSAADRG